MLQQNSQDQEGLPRKFDPDPIFSKLLAAEISNEGPESKLVPFGPSFHLATSVVGKFSTPRSTPPFAGFQAKTGDFKWLSCELDGK